MPKHTTENQVLKCCEQTRQVQARSSVLRAYGEGSRGAGREGGGGGEGGMDTREECLPCDGRNGRHVQQAVVCGVARVGAWGREG